MKKQGTGTTADVLVYQHRRMSDSEIFYVGIGRGSRPFSTYGRSDFWRSYTNKHPYVVDVILQGLTWEEACAKEKSLILEHGRRDMNKGTLLNLTDGGEGGVGRKDSASRVEEKRLFMLRSNPMSRLESRQRVAHSKRGRLRPDMRGVNNPNFKPGVQNKKREGWEIFIRSAEGLHYRDSLRANYNVGLGSELSKLKARSARQLRLKTLNQQQKSDMTQIMNEATHECVHCRIKTNRGNLNRWHNERCKLKKSYE